MSAHAWAAPRIARPTAPPGRATPDRSWSRAAALALALFVAVRLLTLAVLEMLARAHGRDALPLLVKWDAQWYAGIAGNGYGYTRLHEDGRLLSDFAFFPLFPLLERWLAWATGLAYVDAGLVVGVVCSLVAAWGVFAVTDRLHGRRVAVTTTVLWAALPVAVVQWMSYSESLFTALAAWSLHAVLARRWLVAGTLACFAGLTRPVGAAVAAAVVAAAVVHVLSRPRPRRDLRPVLAAVIAPLGTLGYGAWVGVRTGSPDGYFRVAAGWGNGIDGGRAFARWVGGLLAGPDPVAGVLVLLGVSGVIGLLWLCVRQRLPLPLMVFCVLLVVLAFVTSGYFGSKPRYLLPAFPLLIPPAYRLARSPRRLSVTLVAGLALVSAVYGATWLLGPGPP